MILQILNSMLISLGLTIIIEYIVMELLFREERNYLKQFFLVNLITNPAIVLIFNILRLLNFKYILITIIFLEMLVVIIEGKLYKMFLEENNNKWYINSLILNSISYLLGVVISKIYT